MDSRKFKASDARASYLASLTAIVLFRFLYIIVLFMLVSKHSKLPWVRESSGWAVPTGRLCPSQEYVEVESKRQANIA